jgi:hypothetical protein
MKKPPLVCWDQRRLLRSTRDHEKVTPDDAPRTINRRLRVAAGKSRKAAGESGFLGCHGPVDWGLAVADRGRSNRGHEAGNRCGLMRRSRAASVLVPRPSFQSALLSRRPAPAAPGHRASLINRTASAQIGSTIISACALAGEETSLLSDPAAKARRRDRLSDAWLSRLHRRRPDKQVARSQLNGRYDRR